MSLKELITEVISLINIGSRKQATSSPRGWIVREQGLYITDIAKYNQLLEAIYGSDKS